MKLLRLPAAFGDELKEWQVGTDPREVALIPGDALLTESLDCPVSIKSEKEIKQWLTANPDISLWDQEHEILIQVRRYGDRCYYWAANKALWQHWLSILGEKIHKIPLLPDWMLLPAPVDNHFFALRVGGLVIFRHDIGCGGALSEVLSHLVEEMNPRFIGLSGGRELYVLSTAFLCRQITLGARELSSLQARRRWSRTFLPDLLLLLLMISSGILLGEAGKYGWLRYTREPPATQTFAEPARPLSQTGLSRSLEWLLQIQQRGPVQLERFYLQPHQVEMTLRTPLSCNMMKSRLASLSLKAILEPEMAAEGCVITVKEKV